MNGLMKRSELEPALGMLDGFSCLFEPLFQPSQNVQCTKFDVNVYEESNAWIVDAALPGVAKEDISIDIDDGVLEISVEKKENKQNNNKGYVVREISCDKSTRSFRLPRGVDNDNPSAKLKDGILTLAFTKTKQNKIEIEFK